VSRALRLVSLAAMLAAPAAAQEVPMDAGHLAHALDRLDVTARVLYVGAHPDDENTRLLAYLANVRHVTAAYLSMTRGGGGQNLIGPELADLLDIIRTEELLAARRIDGAQQRFTRSRDFGYSKTAKEALEIWGHDAALADVVWVIRTYQPDVIITRFDEKPPNHGHHTASAILAREAFAAAADPSRFPEQLKEGVKTWQATRLLHNIPNWNDEPPPKEALSLDVTAYDARLGLSIGELAALSRSQHRSQGFGVAADRGATTERFLNLAGKPAAKDILDGVPVGWERFGAKGDKVKRALDEARANLVRDEPERAVPALLAARAALAALPDEPRVRDTQAALEPVLTAAAGLFARASAPSPLVVPGQHTKISVEIVLRRPAGLTLTHLRFPDGSSENVDAALVTGERKIVEHDTPVAAATPVSIPYWLQGDGAETRNSPVDGLPRDPAPLQVTASFAGKAGTFDLRLPVVYAWTDPARGERLREVLVAPPSTVTPVRTASMSLNGNPASVVLRVRASQDGVKTSVSVPAPAGWRVEPASVSIELAKAGDETTARFAITPPTGAAAAMLTPVLDGSGPAVREDVIDYPHIPLQDVLQPARVRVAPLVAVVPDGVIGYIEGSGDSVADDLAQLGMRVELLDDEALRNADLSRFHAIVVGIRAFNTRAGLRAQQDRLMRYVENGGTVVVQYNTQNRLGPLEGRVGPYPLTIGRGRVTDERATMTPLASGHELLTRPNAIGPADFDGWVQERGLYFAETWDPKYTPIFSAADPDEKPLEGSLLFAPYGKGRYVFTGLAFFRQLPAGVPGAYRLFLNLIGTAP
jgi:LmbE family N-acetylglucosaminyl deacetylase